jgi:very-short-patch-repair endonuclease
MNPGLAKVARAQSGVFTRRQARECGYSDERIRTELKNRRWLVVVPGVYRVTGTPGGWNTRVWCALLAAGDGAALAGRPAGRLHRIDGVPGYDRLAVAVPLNRRPRRTTGARVDPVLLNRRDVTRRRGIPVLTAARTVVDLAREEPLEVATRVVGDALRTQMVNPDQVARELAAARHWRGIGRARRAVDLADPRLESILEAELLPLITAAGLRVVPQLEVTDQGLFVARLDFGEPEPHLGIEADGYATHALRLGFERDRERAALLQVAGWTLLSFTATKIRMHPHWVVDVIGATARRLSANREISDVYCG